MADNGLHDRLTEAGATFTEIGNVPVPTHYGDAAKEYTAAHESAGLAVRPSRGLIELRGEDRASWLNNLVTNAITTLSPGEGNYAFACNVKGRIVADFNMLVMADALWLDIDRRLIPTVLEHFERYHIVEDVEMQDRGDEFVRFGLAGPKAKEITDALGATHAPAMAQLSHTTVPLCQKQRPFVRHDFAGDFGVELYIHIDDATECWNRLMEIGQPVGLTPVGHQALDMLRIEAGLPASGEEIDDAVLPAETQQIERGISYQKGCYLGQEVVERMRAYGGLARKLVGLRFPAEAKLTAGATLQVSGSDAGRITSFAPSPRLQATVALGYLKTAGAETGTKVTLAETPDLEGEVVALPM